MSARGWDDVRGWDVARAAEELGQILAENPVVQVVAPSGSGLTTLAHRLRESPPPGIRRVGLVEDDPRVHVTGLRETVAEEIALPLEQRAVPRPEMARLVAGELEAAGLTAARESAPEALSGGQIRRLALATVAVTGVDLLVMDSAFSGLDSRARAGLVDRLLRFVRRGGRAVVLATDPISELRGNCGTATEAGLGAGVPVLTPVPGPSRPGAQALRAYLEPDPVPLPARVVPSAGPSILLRGVHAAPGYSGRRRGGPLAGLRRRLSGARRRGPSTAGRGLAGAPEAVVGPVDLELTPGEVTWIRGANGVGKSTLLRALAGLGPTPVDTLGHSVGLAVQDPTQQVIEGSVGKLVGDPGRCTALGLDPQAHPLDLCRRDLRIAQLASVCSLGRDILAADEPDVGLDGEGRRMVFELLAAAARRGAALVLTCHDVAFMAQVAAFLSVRELSLDPGRRA